MYTRFYEIQFFVIFRCIFFKQIFDNQHRSIDACTSEDYHKNGVCTYRKIHHMNIVMQTKLKFYFFVDGNVVCCQICLNTKFFFLFIVWWSYIGAQFIWKWLLFQWGFVSNCKQLKESGMGVLWNESEMITICSLWFINETPKSIKHCLCGYRYIFNYVIDFNCKKKTNNHQHSFAQITVKFACNYSLNIWLSMFNEI